MCIFYSRWQDQSGSVFDPLEMSSPAGSAATDAALPTAPVLAMPSLANTLDDVGACNVLLPLQ